MKTLLELNLNVFVKAVIKHIQYENSDYPT